MEGMYCMDRRQRRSRKAIMEAFISLLEEKSYQRITVQEIIDGADVGRTTFYAHFPTKDDLLAELCNDIFDHVFSESPEKERTHDFSAGNQTLKEHIAHILYHIRESSIPRILRGESSGIFLRCFRQRVTDWLPERIRIGKREGIPRPFMLHQISSSLIAAIEWWLDEDMRTSPEVLAGYWMEMHGSHLDNG